ncbi:MAG: energy transducer TonB [Nitrospinota bacterium]|nr:energy transducer TonB [Nitrospinota bacterium]
MTRPISKFLYYSAAAHLIFFIMAGAMILQTSAAPEPIKVTLLASPISIEQQMDHGEIMDMPQPTREEASTDARILSQWESAAHSPEKGEEAKSKKDAVPREKVNPPAPSKEKSKEDILLKKPAPPQVNVASLTPENRPAEKSNVMNVFSDTPSDKKFQAEVSRFYEKGKESDIERRKVVSAAMVDDPGKPREEPDRLSGLENAKGADLDQYASTAPRDVVDMGDEAVVSFNTRAFEYAGYFNAIRAEVDKVWEYPEEAILGGWSGKVKVLFTLRKDGTLLDVRVLKSAGHQELDESARAALLAAGPYAPFPAGLEKKRIHVVAEFIYQPAFHALQ